MMEPVYESTFDPRLFSPMAAVEDRHFWFVTRNKILHSLYQSLFPSEGLGTKILEIGCGTGNTLKTFEQACPKAKVFGLDLSAEGLRYAQAQTSSHLVQGDVFRLPFGPVFDAVGLFDVLEHFPDDKSILEKLRNILVAQGALILMVPANPKLWSYHDVGNRHCRRYTLHELEQKLIETGYQVEYLTYFMAGVFPLFWMRRKWVNFWSARTNSVLTPEEKVSRDLKIVPLLNRALTRILSLENIVIRRRGRLPLGTSLLAVARKK